MELIDLQEQDAEEKIHLAYDRLSLEEVHAFMFN